ncbi:hypothetical protein LUZ60_005382 [Juncus effusus]|nr:hypothetical protein LUZ60_005382 [Juncus effusus]
MAIICSKDSGVVVTEAKSDLDICCLIEDSTPNVESLLTLRPDIVASELPLPVLTVQFTSFSSGGIAVAVACHHAAADGWGLWQFINSWATTCRHGAVFPELAPIHDRSIIKYPYKEELKKQMLKLYAPNLPKINPSTNKPIQGHIDRCTGRLFTVDLSSVKLLKQRAIQEATSPFSTPTTFQTLAAHFWIAVAHAKGITSEDSTPTILIIPLDCRALLDPPIDTSYTGNCVRSIFVESNGSNLMALDGLSKTCASIAKAISMAKENPLGGTNLNDPAYDIKSFRGLRVVLSGSPKLPVFDADFGWGKPDSHMVVPVNSDGVGIMTAGRDEGTVHLQVTLKGGMKEFVEAFEEGFRC